MDEHQVNFNLITSRLQKWYQAILFVVACVLFLPSVGFGYTELDDYIFIFKDPEYNQHLSSLVTSFSRGVFDPVNDSYYRPLFLDSMVLNYQFAGTNAFGYHLVNILLHAFAVVLVYRFLVALKVIPWQAFLFSLLFAVMPVLVQAVAWIPGRNDVLLALFVIPCLLYSFAFSTAGRWWQMALSAIFFLLALFTKETAVFAAPVGIVLLVFIFNQRLTSKRVLLLGGGWLCGFLFWYQLRQQAAMVHIPIDAQEFVSRFVYRLPLLVQYIGKIVFPFQLSVFPIQQDTHMFFGWLALVLLVVGLLFSGKKPGGRVAAGLLTFLLFLIPALIIPGNVNEQTFEHRLYLPLLGLLLVLPETALFTRLRAPLYSSVVLIFVVVFAVISFWHQYHFKNPLSFWRQAAQSSPHSAAANMLLGQRVDNVKEKYALFRKAYSLDADEKFLNLCYAQMLQEQDSVIESEQYIRREMELTGYPGLDLMMARVNIKKKDTANAKLCLHIAEQRLGQDTLVQKVWYSYYMQLGSRAIADSLRTVLIQQHVYLADTLK